LREQPACFSRRVPLTVVFSDPNIAMVGAQLKDLDLSQVAIGAIDFANQGRARIAVENHGVLRVYADKQDGLLLGAEMCAPRAEHMAQLLALAIGQRATVHSLLRMPFYHPVFEEGLRTALRDASRQLQVCTDSDLASCDPIGAVALD
jgi:dihydrolipoamide dehydrogenase